jgi:hypothetical protein
MRSFSIYAYRSSIVIYSSRSIIIPCPSLIVLLNEKRPRARAIVSFLHTSTTRPCAETPKPTRFCLSGQGIADGGTALYEDRWALLTTHRAGDSSI